MKGDRWGSGGHYWFGGFRSFMHGITGKKSMFPITWSKQRILHEVSDFDPAAMKLMNPKASLKGKPKEWVGSRSIDGLSIKTVIKNDRIVTGFPLDSRYYAMMKPVHRLWDSTPLWARISIGVGAAGAAGTGVWYANQ